MDSISKKALTALNNGLIEEDDVNLNSEEDILRLVEFRVADLLDRTPELLMSYMYRLDIDEHKIQTVFKFSASTSIARQLAELIWARQKKRAHTKMTYQKGNPNFWYEEE